MGIANAYARMRACSENIRVDVVPEVVDGKTNERQQVEKVHNNAAIISAMCNTKTVRPNEQYAESKQECPLDDVVDEEK